MGYIGHSFNLYPLDVAAVSEAGRNDNLLANHQPKVFPCEVIGSPVEVAS
jgi:hypothetical protein